MKFFPQNLENYFYRLAVLTIENSKLTEIHQNDLTAFSNLKVIRLPSNDIQFIEKDLFSFNLKLEVVILDRNKIQNVHPDVFDHLDRLNVLSFGENLCISDSEKDVKSLIKKVKEKCGNFDFSEFLKLKNFKNSTDLKNSELKRENLALKTLNFETSQKVQNLTKFIEELKEKLDEKQTNLTSIFLTVLLAILTVLSVVIVGAVVLLVNQHRNNKDEENEPTVLKIPTLPYNCSIAENIYEDVRPGRNEPGETKIIFNGFLIFKSF